MSGSEAVQVPVEALFAGAWVRLAGTGAVGAPVVVSGAVIGGPDDVETGGLVVLIRTYRGTPDVLVFVDEDDMAELVDDPADHEARAAHAIAPVFGPVESVRVLRREDRRRVVDEHDTFTGEQFGRWSSPRDETGGVLLSVARGHLPIHLDAPGA